jgi:hypothetical protein
MSITINASIIPAFLTIVMLVIMFRPCGSGGGMFNFEPLVRLFWLVPISVVWLIYMGIMLWIK